MSYERQIHDYLNGDLSPDEQSKLFDGIANHPEWRDELTLQMRMQQNMQRDLGHIVIPAAVTTGIFAKLGFAVPTNSGQGFWTRTVTKTVGAVKGLSPKYIFGFVLNSIALAGIGYWAYSSQNSDITDQHRIANQSVTRSSVQQSTSARPRATQPAAAKVNVPLASTPIPATAQRNTAVSEAANSNAVAGVNVVPAASTAAAAQAVQHSEVDNALSTTVSPEAHINEPMKPSANVGKLLASTYLTPTKVIGVADAGAIYYSEDAGKTWIQQQSNTRSDLYGVTFSDQLHGIAVGAGGTILITNNAGREWNTITSGISASLATVAFAGRDTAYVCGSEGSLLRSTTGGASWQKLSSGTTTNLLLLKFENGQRGTVTGNGVVLHTNDAGQSWH